jgi:hypothetical protein
MTLMIVLCPSNNLMQRETANLDLYRDSNIPDNGIYVWDNGAQIIL